MTPTHLRDEVDLDDAAEVETLEKIKTFELLNTRLQSEDKLRTAVHGDKAFTDKQGVFHAEEKAELEAAAAAMFGLPAADVDFIRANVSDVYQNNKTGEFLKISKDEGDAKITNALMARIGETPHMTPTKFTHIKMGGNIVFTMQTQPATALEGNSMTKSPSDAYKALMRRVMDNNPIIGRPMIETDIGGKNFGLRLENGMVYGVAFDLGGLDTVSDADIALIQNTKPKGVPLSEFTAEEQQAIKDGQPTQAPATQAPAAPAPAPAPAPDPNNPFLPLDTSEVKLERTTAADKIKQESDEEIQAGIDYYNEKVHDAESKGETSGFTAASARLLNLYKAEQENRAAAAAEVAPVVPEETGTAQDSNEEVQRKANAALARQTAPEAAPDNVLTTEPVKTPAQVAKGLTDEELQADIDRLAPLVKTEDAIEDYIFEDVAASNKATLESREAEQAERKAAKPAPAKEAAPEAAPENKPLESKERRALEQRAEEKDTSPAHQAFVDRVKKRLQQSRQELEAADNPLDVRIIELEIVEDENRLRFLAGEPEVDTSGVTPEIQAKETARLEKSVATIKAKIEAGEEITNNERYDWRVAGEDVKALPAPAPKAAKPTPVASEPAPTPEAPTPLTKTVTVKRNGVDVPVDIKIKHFRFGKPDAGEASTNHLTGKKEKGVSVYEGYQDPKTGEIFLLPTGSEETNAGEAVGTQDALISGEAELVEVTGVPIKGPGADGEVLLDPTSIATKAGDLRKNLVTDREPTFENAEVTSEGPDGFVSPEVVIVEGPEGFQLTVGGVDEGVWGSQVAAERKASQEVQHARRVAERKAAKPAPTKEAAPEAAPEPKRLTAKEKKAKAAQELANFERAEEVVNRVAGTKTSTARDNAYNAVTEQLIKDPDTDTALLVTIAKRGTTKGLRKAESEAQKSGKIGTADTGALEGIAAEVSESSDADEKKLLDDAIDTLPRLQKAAVRGGLDEKTDAEIAKEQNSTVKAVGQARTRGLAKVNSLLSPTAEGISDADVVASLNKVIGPELGVTIKAVKGNSPQIRAARKLAKFFGRRVIVVSGSPADGMFHPSHPDVLLISNKSSRAETVIMFHELLHSLKETNPKAYAELKAAVDVDLDAYVKAYPVRDEGNVSDTNEEFLADFLADRATTPEFWEKLAATDKGLAATLKKFLNRLLKKIRESRLFTESFVKNLEQADAAATKALQTLRDEGIQKAGAPGPSKLSLPVIPKGVSAVSSALDHHRVGTAKLGTDAVPAETPQESNISGEIVPEDMLGRQMNVTNYAHLPKNILNETNPVKKHTRLKNWYKKNLLALYNSFPAEFRERATHWYDGANKIATEFANAYNTTLPQSAGVLAVLSPQKDWFMNVAQGEQVMAIWDNHRDTKLTEDLIRAELEDISSAAEPDDDLKRKAKKGASKLANTRRRNFNKKLELAAIQERRALLEEMIGKTINDLDSDPYLQGWAIRVLAQSVYGRGYQVISPEGDPLFQATKLNGEVQKNGWGSISEIKKAVRILKGESISENLGDEHKVRNFYNNIVSPNSPFGDATIDTHAVAAAHILPMGSSAREVKHNFGAKMSGSGKFGISGNYHTYLDAYREAAAEAGIQPRQMQSVVWEAIRLVYTAKQRRNKPFVANRRGVWNTLGDAEARTELLREGIAPPAWAGTEHGGQPGGVTAGPAETREANDSGGGLRFRGGTARTRLSRAVVPIARADGQTQFSEEAYQGVGTFPPSFKSRSILIRQMPIADFLTLAETLPQEQSAVARKVLARGEQFNELPFITFGDNGEVVGHEGRHRAIALLNKGFKTMPVDVRSYRIRWGEQQDPESFDYTQDWPTETVSENGVTFPFPLSRDLDYTPVTEAGELAAADILNGQGGEVTSEAVTRVAAENGFQVEHVPGNPNRAAEVGSGTVEDFVKNGRANQDSTPFGTSVDIYPTEDYTGYELITMRDGDQTATISISPDGEVGSVTKSAGGDPSLVQAAFDAAIATGKVRWLNGFDTILPGKYAKLGFKVRARVLFDPQYKPPGWDFNVYKKFNNGQPDVVFMSYEGTPQDYSPGDGAYVDTFNAGVEAASVAPQKTKLSRKIFSSMSDTAGSGNPFWLKRGVSYEHAEKIVAEVTGFEWQEVPLTKNGFARAKEFLLSMLDPDMQIEIQDALTAAGYDADRSSIAIGLARASFFAYAVRVAAADPKAANKLFEQGFILAKEIKVLFQTDEKGRAMIDASQIGATLRSFRNLEGGNIITMFAAEMVGREDFIRESHGLEVAKIAEKVTKEGKLGPADAQKIDQSIDDLQASEENAVAHRALLAAEKRVKGGMERVLRLAIKLRDAARKTKLSKALDDKISLFENQLAGETDMSTLLDSMDSMITSLESEVTDKLVAKIKTISRKVKGDGKKNAKKREKATGTTTTKNQVDILGKRVIGAADRATNENVKKVNELKEPFDELLAKDLEQEAFLNAYVELGGTEEVGLDVHAAKGTLKIVRAQKAAEARARKAQKNRIKTRETAKQAQAKVDQTIADLITEVEDGPADAATVQRNKSIRSVFAGLKRRTRAVSRPEIEAAFAELTDAAGNPLLDADRVRVLSDTAEEARVQAQEKRAADLEAKRADAELEDAKREAKKAGVSETQAARLFDLPQEKTVSDEGGPRTVRQIIQDEVIDNPARQILDQNDRIKLAEEILTERTDLTPEQVKRVAKQVEANLTELLVTKKAKIAEDIGNILGKGGNLTPDQINKAVRLEVFDPTQDFAGSVAALAGWDGLTPDQMRQLAEYEAKITAAGVNTRTAMWYRFSQMRIIKASTGITPNSRRLLNSYLRGSMYSSTNSQFLGVMVGGWVLGSIYIREGFKVAFDPKIPMSERFSEILNFQKVVGGNILRGAREAKAVWQSGGTSFHSQLMGGQEVESQGKVTVDELTTLYDQSTQRLSAAVGAYRRAQGTAKAKPAAKIALEAFKKWVVAGQRFTFQGLSSVDAAVTKTSSSIQAQVLADRRARAAGLNRPEMDAIREDSYNHAKGIADHLRRNDITNENLIAIEVLDAVEGGIFQRYAKMGADVASLIEEAVGDVQSQIGTGETNDTVIGKLTDIISHGVNEFPGLTLLAPAVRTVGNVTDELMWTAPIIGLYRAYSTKGDSVRAKRNRAKFKNVSAEWQFAKRRRLMWGSHAMTAIAGAMLAMNDDLEDEDKWFWYTGFYPAKDKSEQERWAKQGNKWTEHTLIVFGTHIRLDRGFGQSMLLPMVAASTGHRVTKNVRATVAGNLDVEKAYDEAFTDIIGHMGLILPGFSSGESFSRAVAYRGGAINYIQQKASVFVPFSGLAKTPRRLNDRINTKETEASAFNFNPFWVDTDGEGVVVYKNSLGEKLEPVNDIWNYVRKLGIPIYMEPTARGRDPEKKAALEFRINSRYTGGKVSRQAWAAEAAKGGVENTNANFNAFADAYIANYMKQHTKLVPKFNPESSKKDARDLQGRMWEKSKTKTYTKLYPKLAKAKRLEKRAEDTRKRKLKNPKVY